ncbi:hypothetical protein [Bacillus sp. FJAT-22090]|uniref:hypothetical protein n=1 Tax=Bacillus sp. FJAT-22090 TaxID=1581038 RepID=UPI0016424461|nr:hypothetical protein [Bacillus sp. FJAT-22090]
MNNKKSNNSVNKKMNTNHVSSNFTEYQKLTDNEKKKLQVKDGQNNHHVDERGGF